MGSGRFEEIADVEVGIEPPATVYAEGWQTWTPVRLYRVGETTERAPDQRSQTVMWRPGRRVPDGVIQAEGLLAIAPLGGPARAWFSPDPGDEVATLHLRVAGDRLQLSADGPVEELQYADLDGVLTAVGDRLGAGPVNPIPPGWCSWSCYFKDVTEADVMENVEAAIRMSLPIEIVQLDDGYETEVGDWLEVRPGFGSLERMADRIRSAGLRPGIWIAPFMVSPSSALARAHPNWLVPDVDAGLHWGLDMRILDITHPVAAEYLMNVFRTLSDWGFSYYKLDFLYAGAIEGRRHRDGSGLEAYREGLRMIRSAIAPNSLLLVGGAPLLPSLGLCDAMRVGPDVLPEVPNPQLVLQTLIRITSLRSWMNGRLWVNDPDCLVARPEIREREGWASYLEGYHGVRFSSDRLTTLDRRGLELTRRFLTSS